MIIVDCIQNTPEWFNARSGIPTSSEFDKIITTKGEPSKQRQKYLWKLAGERILGFPEESYQNAAMLRGTQLQDEARNLYRMIHDAKIQEVGFCLSDGTHKYGASPDGLVDENGGLEIKCPSLAVHVGYLLENKLPTDYFQQVQGQLLVTGREYFDFMSYYPSIKPLIIRVSRDEGFLLALKTELEIFCEELEDTIRKIQF